MSWEDPRCRRDGLQTTALTDPEGWPKTAPRAHREPCPGGPTRRRQEALVLKLKCVLDDALATLSFYYD